MARGRRLDELRADARKRADVEGATARHPDADVTRYVNQGYAELYDLLVEARGRSYFRNPTPLTITTAADTSRYALPAKFYRLISVRRSDEYADMLVPFTQQDEPLLRMESAEVDFPTHYELQNGYIELLPLHEAGHTIIAEYVPSITDLSADGDTVDGVNGWEEYIVCFAAKCMAVKDEEYALVSALNSELMHLQKRISKLAPTRDAFRAERVKDVRGVLPFGWIRR